MKTAIAYIVLFFSSFFIVPYHWYIQKLSKTNPEEAWERAYKLIRWFFNCELKLVGCKMTVLGQENIPKDQACLFVGNHRSFFDILISHNSTGKPAGFISKDSMKKVPLLRLYMRDMGSLFLERDNIKVTEIRPIIFSHSEKAVIKWLTNPVVQSYRLQSPEVKCLRSPLRARKFQKLMS